VCLCHTCGKKNFLDIYFFCGIINIMNIEQKENKKQVVILRGTSGSGKSTFIKNSFPQAVVCSADHFFLDNDGNYNFDPKALGKAHSQCQYKFSRALDEGMSCIIVDNTNTRAKEMRPYINMANEADYDILIVRLEVAPEVAASRNVHGVPADVVRAMCERLRQPLPNNWPKELVIKSDK
jgi:predicted kinase